MKLPDPTDDLDEIRFHQRAPKRNYLTKREAEMLLSLLVAAMTDESEAPEEPEDVKTANRRRTNCALAARDHAAFSAMMYAGLRIERRRTLRQRISSSGAAKRRCGLRRARATKNGSCQWCPKLRKVTKTLPQGPGRSRSCRRSRSTDPRSLSLFEREGTKGHREHPAAQALQVGQAEPHKETGHKASRLEAHLPHLVPAGQPGAVLELAELMGHSDISQVMKYALSEEQRVRAGVTRL